MPVKDEDDWLEISVRSIIDFVDELIIVDDGSADKTPEIIKNLSEEFDNIKILSPPKIKNKYRFSSILNHAFSSARNDWVMHWAGDFIAYTEGPNSIQKLFEKVLENNEEWDAIVFKTPNLSGDIYHYEDNKEFAGPEPYIFKKGYMRFDPHIYSDNRFPKEGMKFCWTHEGHHFLHINTLKSLSKLAYRSNMNRYMLRSDEEVEISYWEWLARFRLGKEEVSSVEVEKVRSSIIDQTREMSKRYLPYDFEKWGQHPSILFSNENWKKFNIVLDFDDLYKLDYPV